MAHYRLLRKLGSGGMGDVYLAQDTILDRSVALKVLSNQVDSDPAAMRRFIEEAKAASALNHQNIATIYELRDDESLRFIVMEYVEGQTLQEKIAGRSLDLAEISKIAVQIADALDAAHKKGIVHGDIKPANIMITAQGKVKVLDFGLSRRIVPEPAPENAPTQIVTQAAPVMGTVHYMSPEQALGKTVDHRSDLFSFGIVLYEMVAGRLPFTGSTVIEIINHILNTEPEPIPGRSAKVPGGLERIIRKCLDKRVEGRFQSAHELMDDLRKSESDAGLFRERARSRNNLPRQLTRFIGRQNEISGIGRLLAANRLVTLTGAGGVGKTRLALQAAQEVLSEYEDGVWLVDLAPLSEAALVPETVAAAMGVREEKGKPVLETLADYLESKNVLLALDNCEHLIGACAQLVETLLSASSNLRILTTSREALRIAGESVFNVPSLALPDEHHLPAVDRLSEYDAIQLFIDRARSVHPAFEATSQNAQTLAQVCIRLDGIPLAIELAASRVKILSLDQIHVRLANQLMLLTGGRRTALARQQTLRAAIDWSYNLLSTPEQALFRRLSVFSGGWTLEAAEATCAADGVEQTEVLELLSGLVDKSVVSAEDRGGKRRYEFLESLRQYSEERLSKTAEADTMRRRHAGFYLQFAEEAEAKLRGPDLGSTLEQLNAEYGNLRASLTWALAGNIEDGMRLACALQQFWDILGHWNEARTWLEKVLARQVSPSPGAARARVLNAASVVAKYQGDYVSSCSFAEEALSVSRKVDDQRETARALRNLGNVSQRQGDYEKAHRVFEEALVISRKIKDKREIAALLNSLGVEAFLRSKHLAARSRLEEALALWRELGDKREIAKLLHNLGSAASVRGDYAAARSFIEESLAAQRELRDKYGIAASLNNLASIAQRHGEYGAARPLLEESLTLRRELGDKQGVAVVLSNMGFGAQREGDYPTAHSLHEESLRIRQELGDKQGIAGSLTNLGELAYLQTDYSAAHSLHTESLKNQRELGDAAGIVESLDQLAAVALALRQSNRAVYLWGAAQALRERVSAPRAPADRDEHDRRVNAARAALNEEAFAIAWSQGQNMTLDQAIAYALSESPGPPN